MYFREKERVRDRDDMWSKVETLAMRNPSYQKAPFTGSNNSSIDLASPNADGEEVDITYEKLEAEAREVRNTDR